jgi:hypothetical protein
MQASLDSDYPGRKQVEILLLAFAEDVKTLVRAVADGTVAAVDRKYGNGLPWKEITTRCRNALWKVQDMAPVDPDLLNNTLVGLICEDVSRVRKNIVDFNPYYPDPVEPQARLISTIRAIGPLAIAWLIRTLNSDDNSMWLGIPKTGYANSLYGLVSHSEKPHILAKIAIADILGLLREPRESILAALETGLKGPVPLACELALKRLSAQEP